MAATNELTTDQKALYDRQIGALGMAAMQKLTQQKVLIVGLRGLGVEIAKNVILAGPKAVCLADAGVVECVDLSAQFYLKEEDVGKARAEACLAQLQELNPYVEVTSFSGAITGEFLSQFTAVVMTCSTPEEKSTVNAFCRKQEPPISFIAAEIHGLFGYIFDDFGPGGHTIVDPDGEKLRVGWVGGITQDSPCQITFLEGFPYCFQEGDYLQLSEVQGMTEINDLPPVRVTRVTKYTIDVDLDSSTFSAYSGTGGVATQVKMPTTVEHRSLDACMKEPGELMESDFAKFGRPAQLHAAFAGLQAFQRAHEGALPELNDIQHAKEVYELACAWNEAQPEAQRVQVDPRLVRLLALHARSELSPMASIFGGIVAQEVVKTTGKYTPFNQLFYFDALECLAEEQLAVGANTDNDAGEANGAGGDTNNDEDLWAPIDDAFSGTGSRYDGQIAVFGKDFQEKLLALNYFIVGAGALGCELLKGFAMMGIGCGQGGQVHVTDMDRIEPSNLNRQFLFRNWDLQRPKSLTAAAAIQAMNPAININAIEMRVGTETENFFNDAFWMSLDGVANALDNVPARLYVDSKCVQYKKSLLESGTLGTKANVQVVIPHLTESYGSSPDPPEQSVPQCTLHNFPYLIEHCIQLAREEFETLFANAANNTVAFLERGQAHLDSVTHPHEKRVMIESINEMLDAAINGVTYDDCIEWARNQFEHFFNYRIQQILILLPPDKLNAAGQPFWSGTKRLPAPIEYDPEDPLSASFVHCCANLRAFQFGINPNPDVAAVAAAAAAVEPKPFVPSTSAKIQTDEKEEVDNTPEDADDDDQVTADLLPKITEKAKNIQASAIHPVEFEKDDDSNYHVDMVHASSSLRARNYSITEITRLKTKMIAGRIIPALATTTAMTTGFVLLELYKLVHLANRTDAPAPDAALAKFKNGFFNLALPLFAFSEPLPPKKMTSTDDVRYVPDGHTLWDRFEITGDVTLQEILDWFQANHQLEVSMVSIGESLVFASFMPAHQARLQKKVSELLLEVAHVTLEPHMKQIQLVVGCENADGDDVDVPALFVLL